MAYRTKRRAKRRQAARRRSWWSNRRLIRAGALGLVLAAVGYSVFATSLLDGSGQGSATAELAPDITLATPAGHFQLSDHRGEVFLLYFSFPG